MHEFMEADSPPTSASVRAAESVSMFIRYFLLPKLRWSRVFLRVISIRVV